MEEELVKIVREINKENRQDWENKFNDYFFEAKVWIEPTEEEVKDFIAKTIAEERNKTIQEEVKNSYSSGYYSRVAKQVRQELLKEIKAKISAMKKEIIPKPKDDKEIGLNLINTYCNSAITQILNLLEE